MFMHSEWTLPPWVICSVHDSCLQALVVLLYGAVSGNGSVSVCLQKAQLGVCSSLLYVWYCPWQHDGLCLLFDCSV